jgi:hypothetical protein
VIVLPRDKANVQELPQVIPLEVLSTVPVPFTVTVSNAWFNAKFAVHDLFAFIVTDPSVQSEFPVHPANTEPVPGSGVNATTRPDV